MSVMIYKQKFYNCELDSIDVYFEHENPVVFCTGEKTISRNEIDFRFSFAGFSLAVCHFDKSKAGIGICDNGCIY